MTLISKMLDLTGKRRNMFSGKKQQKLPPIVDRHLLMPAHKLSKLIKDGSVSPMLPELGCKY